MAGFLKHLIHKLDNTISPTASLPEPHGLLKKRVPLKAIELENAKVMKLTCTLLKNKDMKSASRQQNMVLQTHCNASK